VAEARLCVISAQASLLDMQVPEKVVREICRTIQHATDCPRLHVLVSIKNRIYLTSHRTIQQITHSFCRALRTLQQHPQARKSHSSHQQITSRLANTSRDNSNLVLGHLTICPAWSRDLRTLALKPWRFTCQHKCVLPLTSEDHAIRTQ